MEHAAIILQLVKAIERLSSVAGECVRAIDEHETAEDERAARFRQLIDERLTGLTAACARMHAGGRREEGR